MNLIQKGLCCILLCMLSFSLAAHSPSESHSTLEIKEQQLVVQIELPWSFVNAVKQAFPIAGSLKTKNEFMPYVHKYLDQNFTIRKEGEEVSIANIKEQAGAHSHSSVMVLTFEVASSDQLAIENTIMFNLNSEQKNYHKILNTDSSDWMYLTKQEQASFVIGNHENKVAGISTTMKIWFLNFCLVIIAVVFYLRSNKRFLGLKMN